MTTFSLFCLFMFSISLFSQSFPILLHLCHLPIFLLFFSLLFLHVTDCFFFHDMSFFHAAPIIFTCLFSVIVALFCYFSFVFLSYLYLFPYPSFLGPPLHFFHSYNSFFHKLYFLQFFLNPLSLFSISTLILFFCASLNIPHTTFCLIYWPFPFIFLLVLFFAIIPFLLLSFR